ncbi:sensor histidine kinase [Thalassotalea piscium]|uniref:histidine kinase n=1 Tax=Thalassotalea piscium TaxID=1230533 RepID=A0A7X0NK66_9GAMM|nr:HAMP domain-containing sensor histidine kinase [Thalassotalea piscium]MBB6544972.1 two-component system sensor histidine kinase GlrK [Thalassotalea piscium]
MQQWIKKISFYHVSIKTLTLMGFGLVALPLVFAFLYSANQVNKLSEQGTTAIFNVAELVENNRQVSQTLTRLERFASQYVVLKEHELLNQYLERKAALKQILVQEFSQYNDEQFRKIIQQYNNKLIEIDQLIQVNSVNSISLEQLQRYFRELALVNQQLALHSNKVINQQASNMENSANQVKRTMLFSLLIIPITLLIAGIFIVLITLPLKVLLGKIKLLEQGNFQQPITVDGSIEIEEIAEALELMRSRLHALELQKSSFIRHISHELKTPLAAIREGTELLYDNSVGALNNDQQEITHIIRTSVNRLQRLIEDLLDFNIVLDSTSLQDAEVINLAKEVKSALELRILDLKRKQLTIIQKVDNITIQCNSKQLSVILDNLLSNAVKFSPENGIITIKSWVEEHLLHLTITDQGAGISSHDYNQVFDAFYQGSTAHNSQIKSSGLGLTIVKELLMRLNGTISIDSSTKSPSYTTFKITLPKAQLISPLSVTHTEPDSL